MIMSNIKIDNMDNRVIELIDKLSDNNSLDISDYEYILKHIDINAFEYLKAKSREATDLTYGNKVYFRGLIELSNYCCRNCNYCGIHAKNDNVERYRLSKEDVLQCCMAGYEIGYRTFVMQGGEDMFYSKEVLSDIISEIKKRYSDVAITLSIGERSYEDYKAFYDAGADRFLLRHEAASKRLYEYLHPDSMSYDVRRRCILDLKEIGYQTGVGFMVGSPSQTNFDLAMDLKYIEEIQPAMCGIGPYITHSATPFKDCESGRVDHTLVMVALTRLIVPKCLLPATTALATLSKTGRMDALLLGANVIMPNLSPSDVRSSYEIYEGKVFTGSEAHEYNIEIIEEINSVGLEVELVRGDSLMEEYNVYKQ